MKKVGDIKVGDYLYDRRGNPTKVLAVYPHKNLRAFKVTLKDGRSFICCDEHLVPFYGYAKAVRIQHKPLGDMLNDYKITTGQGYTKFKYRIPQNEAVEFPETPHVIPPYALGVLIGDGCLTESSLGISSSEVDIMQKVADMIGYPVSQLKQAKSSYTWRFTNHDSARVVRDELDKMGLRGKKSGEKFIPDEYLYDSIENRIELLKGLLDTDGRVVISHKKSRHYAFSTLNPHLAEQVRQLCLSLGYGVNVNTYDYGEGTHDISVRIYTPDIIVSSEKHMARVHLGTHKSTYDKMTPIVDITEVEPRDMTCFTVDNDESLFLINDYIVTHNTLVTLTGLVELAQEGRLGGHILVIAPKRIAINTWPDEIQKWEHVRGARHVVLAGLSKAKRDKLLDEVETAKPTIYIINRELIPKLVDRFPGEAWQFPNIVIDEAQSFKGYGSLGFKKLKSIAPYTERFIELTGTPAPNGLMDIWSLIYLLDGGARLGKNITQYRNTFFVEGRRTPEGYPYEWWLKEHAAEEIHRRIKDVAISMTKADYLDMPDLIHNPVELDMSAAEKKVYNQLKQDKVLPLADGGAIESANAAVLAGALFQLSNGAIYEDESRSNIIELHKHKLNALEEIVDGSNQEPILCFYWFKHDLARLQKHFPDGETFTGKPEQLKRWNEGKIPLLFAQPASAGHGLNFQHGGHIIVFFCVPRSLELYEQSIARLYRNGQTQTVIVHYLMMRGTIEKHIMETLIGKQYDQNALIDAVKASL